MERRHWIGVASAEHVALGREAGFMQLCHGKAAPLKRIAPGDAVAYYSPSSWMRGGERMQAFTAIGTVAAGDPYQVEMAPGFRPFRRDVLWVEARQAPIHPLLPRRASPSPPAAPTGATASASAFSRWTKVIFPSSRKPWRRRYSLIDRTN